MSRLPSLGPRGEGWVVIQFGLIGAIFLAGLAGPSWEGTARVVSTVLGIGLVVAGLGLAVRGSWDLRAAITPLPYPRAEAELVETGVYARVRHPIYGGLLLAASGWSLATASVVALALTFGLWLFFEGKSRREERWLVERFPGYLAYRERTHRFMPWLG
jgi:protein-S-isoprenylcysteine O-methyltransferase Ste14